MFCGDLHLPLVTKPRSAKRDRLPACAARRARARALLAGRHAQRKAQLERLRAAR